MFQDMLALGSGGGGSITPTFINQSAGATISSAVASSTMADSRFTVEKSYDGSSATAWIPVALGNGVPYNVVYDLGSAQNIYLISLLWGCSDSSTYVTKVSIYGSSDNSRYDLIVPETTITITGSPWNAQTQRDIALIGRNYRYFKIVLERVSGAGNYCVGIGEIVFLKNE